MVFTSLLTVACGGGDDGNNSGGSPPNPDNELIVENGSVAVLSYNSAVIYCTVRNGGELSLTEMGVFYGEQKDVAKLSSSGQKATAETQKTVNQKTIQFSVNLNNLNPNTTYYYCAYAKDKTANGTFSFKTPVYPGCPDNNHPHKIDLGLPSGTLWSCCNLRATVPQGSGLYYAWGEVNSKTTYDRNSYLLKNGSSAESSIYLGADIAGTKYDAATAKWGEPWRMPSQAQREELTNHTTSVWTTLNGVKGRKFIGANGEFIFVPAVGYKYADQSYENSDNSDYVGHYWLSTASEGFIDNAYCWRFDKDRTYNNLTIQTSSRIYGYTIRPVCN